MAVAVRNASTPDAAIASARQAEMIARSWAWRRGESGCMVGRVLRLRAELRGHSRGMDTSIERAARNEAVFRNANELIEEQLNDLSVVDGRSPFVCECQDPDCAEVIRLSLSEYEHVRSNPSWFAIAPGHTFIEGMVVQRTERFEVIAKQGDAGKVAQETDPRSAG